MPKLPKIPILSVPDSPIVATTQNHVPIAEIVDDVVLYKNGGAALVMESTSLNFGLLSEKEQSAVVAAYAALLNSLSFPIEIVIRSQRKDISSYMVYFDEVTKNLANQKLRFLVDSYKHFILDSIKKKNVLGKKFYIVIPFSNFELGTTKSFVSIYKKVGPLPFTKSYAIKKAKITLYPKRDHLIRQVGRLGIKLRQLGSNELIDLYYNLYNQEVHNFVPKEAKII